MNFKKTLVSILTILIMIACMLVPNIVNAATTYVPAYYGIIELMQPNFGYAIGDPNSNVEGSNKAAKIWNIVKYKSADKSSGYDDLYIYCIKAGAGFTTAAQDGTAEPKLYNVSYDMKTQREAIKDQNDVLSGLVDKQIPIDDHTNISAYDAVLAVFDMMYMPEESDESVKQNLINAIIEYAQDPESGYTEHVEKMQEYPLEDDDIVAIQQAVLWYFTNYGEDDGKYDKTNDKSWLYYTTDGSTYNALKDYTPNSLQPQNDAGQARSWQAELLYNYMISEAKANANKYSKYASVTPETGTIKPATLNTQSLQYTTSGDKYIIGPINITETENNEIPYTIDFVVKNNSDNVEYKLLDQNQADVEESKTVKDLVGNNFYISIPRSSVTKLSVDIAINYANTKMTLLASETSAQEQPLVIPEKENKKDEKTLELTPTKAFDLALRKYITKIERNGKQITFPTRVPTIEEGTISSETTTATYKHRKDPVMVQTNDKVTYSLTIYNEGEKPGRATEIVDQLPTGLKYERVVSGNFVFSSYNEQGDNKLTLVRNPGNEENLPAYTQNSLISGTGAETIEIECTVTATPDTQNKKILTNVAWISKEKDGETGTEITNQAGADRDSEPATTPKNKQNSENVNKDNMSDYIGGNETTQNKEDLTDSGFYYKGQQDDDDFEKLVILPEAFDLKLVKYISKVNNEDIAPRIKDIDVSKLNTLDENGNIITTAEYELDKEPVQVKQGDIVTYTFKIFNEGTIDGYAKEITEDVPDGLEFLWSDKQGEDLQNDTSLTQEEKDAIKLNQEYLWKKFVYNDLRDRIIQISSDYLSLENEAIPGQNLIQAFGRNDDGAKTKDDLHSKEISICFKVIAENVSGPAIRNEAAITDDNIVDENGEEKEIDDRDSKTDEWKKYEDDEDYDNVILKSFDLALRKFIIAVSNDTEIEEEEYLKNADSSYERAPQVDTLDLNEMDEYGELITTARYNHIKEPVKVKVNDYVVYMLRVYNEGDIDGYAGEIQDHLPPYLKFVQNDFNTDYGWSVSEDGRTVTTNYLRNEKINKAVEREPEDLDDAQKYELSYKEVPIMCQVIETAKTDENITNIADITEYLDENKKEITDRDSKEENVKLPEDEDLPGYKEDETGGYIPGQEDDDDFEKVVVKPFDLALRKFIIAVSDDTEIEEEEYLKDENDTYTREPQVDTSKLNKVGKDGKVVTTATYNHTKEPVEVKRNDIVVYMLRVYNEGEIDGYAGEIQDHLPPYLKFIQSKFNTDYGWSVSEDGRTVTTRYLENSIIKKIQENEDGEIELSYQEVPIMCKVAGTAKTEENITNIADITEYLDEDKDKITDRDSEEENVELPEDEDLPGYKDDEEGDYIPGQEDDDDFEKVVIRPFDLALRKFITKVEGKAVDTRIPQVKYDAENNKLSYEHTKDPVRVVTGNTVIYTLRVYNEGAKDGYAAQILDDIPDGLEYLPENSTNTQYRWKMYRQVKDDEVFTQQYEEGRFITQDGKKYVLTENADEAEVIVTDYLSKEQGESRMQEEDTENPNLLKAFNPNAEISDTNPNYKEVKVAFKVVEANSSNKTIVNEAQISKDTDKDGKEIDDEDSVPGEWNDGEDDQDKEYIDLAEFDLSLRKWVTQAIVIENGKESITQTGHQPYDDPEKVVKVEIHRNKLNKVTVKFRYSIRVTNEGDIEGYAKEVTDYVPQGLKFVAEDNPGWKDEGNNVISTRLLENTLLKPGEYAEVEVLLTWINGSDNMGVMENTAEISEDYNEPGVPDKDSTPDNKKEGEDDIDDAPVMLSISTGQIRIYFTLGFVILITIAGGVVLIKKFVL